MKALMRQALNSTNHFGPVVLIAATLFFVAACSGGSPAPTNNDSSASPAAAPSASVQASPLSDFEEALRFVRNGQYTYIWVFSRKDGKPLTPADSIFLKMNAPQLVDLTATTDKTKAIGGTNFNLEEGNMELLRRRFNVEDYSNK